MPAIKPRSEGPKLRLQVLLPLIVLIISFSACNKKSSEISYKKYIDTAVSVYGPYQAVKLPITAGIKIANPIQLSLGPGGFLYASNQTGEVYSLRDTDNDGIEDLAKLYCNVNDFGLRSPSGFAFRGDTIFIGTAQQVRAFLDIDNDGKADSSWAFFDDIPNSEHPYEWTTGLNFGPDGWLYLGLSTDSWNAAPSPDPKGYRGSILRISPDGKRAEQIATGIRSVYSMSFDSRGDLFFTDNEGGGNPNEELNLLVQNSFYGHNPQKYRFDSVTSPVHELQSEVAPSGIEFNKTDNDFGGTAGDLFIAFYGAGERWTRGGVASVKMQRQPDGKNSFEEKIVADIAKLSDLAFGRDGSLYLAQHGKADYWYNAVYENQGTFYKLIYDPSLKGRPLKSRRVVTTSLSSSSVENGKQLFAEHACLGCHAVDGVTELLGPNLKDVGKRLTREDILEEILTPSETIKPSMMAVRIIKKDGKHLIGRVVNASEDRISLMLVGNHVVEISRKEIERSENEKKSLMYEGLVTDLSTEQMQSLLDYLFSLTE